MKVYLGVGDSWAELGSKGITLRVRDNSGNQLGRLRVGKAQVEWCAKHGKMGYGKRIGIERLIKLLEEN